MMNEWIFYYTEEEAFECFINCLEKGIFASIDRSYTPKMWGVEIHIDKTLEAKNAKTKTEN